MKRRVLIEAINGQLGYLLDTIPDQVSSFKMDTDLWSDLVIDIRRQSSQLGRCIVLLHQLYEKTVIKLSLEDKELLSDVLEVHMDVKRDNCVDPFRHSEMYKLCSSIMSDVERTTSINDRITQVESCIDEIVVIAELQQELKCSDVYDLDLT